MSCDEQDNGQNFFVMVMLLKIYKSVSGNQKLQDSLWMLWIEKLSKYSVSKRSPPILPD